MASIYAITHLATGTHYIGSSRDVIRRLRDHRSLLCRSKHENERLQYAWNKYGADAFEFDAIEEVPIDDLIAREQAYLDAFFGQLYNLNRRADVPPNMRGVPKSAAHRAKIGAKSRERMNSKEARARMSATWRGRPKSVEQRAKISATKSGHTLSLAHRANIAACGLGRKHTADTRAKMRASALGHGCSDDTRAKIGAASRGRRTFLGRTHSEETKAKISAAAIARTAAKRSIGEVVV